VVAGIEAGLQTILVLAGITTREEAERFPFLPSRILDSVADLVDEVADRPVAALGRAETPPADQPGRSSQNGLA
jgi:HAD-hyrolase-like